ncbi:MAG: DegT/DnrJ/EryC1/StrS aminotransferase family protein [Thermoleophilia bacterium]
MQPRRPRGIEGVSEAGQWLSLPLETPRQGRRSLTSWPAYDNDEILAVADVLRSGNVNYWTGQHGRLFEQEFAEYVGTRHAVALANGTVALEAAVIGLGLEPGDEFVVTPRSFIASVTAPMLRGLKPVFADVDRESQNITPSSIEKALTPSTKAIVAVHLAGWPCDMDAIAELADAHGLVVIEDCAQAHGARWRGRAVGSLGQVGAWSFCQDKIMTTGGEGGMLTTSEDAVWERVWSYKDHGKSWEAVHDPDPEPGFRWLHSSLGTNWRLNEPQSVMGRLQLGKLDRWVEQRRANAAYLDRRLGEIPGLRIAVPPEEAFHSYYRYYCFVEPERLARGWSRDRILEAFERRGIPGRSGSCPEIYREKAFEGTGLAPKKRLPVARELGETSLAFPVHHRLGEPELAPMADAVAEVMAEATR